MYRTPPGYPALRLGITLKLKGIDPIITQGMEYRLMLLTCLKNIALWYLHVLTVILSA